MSSQKKNEPQITAEQEALLREKFRREFQAEQHAAAGVRDPDEFVYTNVSRNKRAVIADLGTHAGKNYYPATLEPGEVKDFSEDFKPRDIRASRMLKALQKDEFDRKSGALLRPAIIKQGRHAVTEAIDPLTQRAIDDPEGTIRDPLSGQRPYDLRLKEEEAKIERDNNRTSAG